MSFLGRLFKRKKGGTRAGRFIRNLISSQTMGISDNLGLTDGHMVDGDESNGEYKY